MQATPPCHSVLALRVLPAHDEQPMGPYVYFLVGWSQSIPFLRLHLLPRLEIFDALRALPAQPLTVNANVQGLPPFATEHQPTGQIAAPAAGWLAAPKTNLFQTE